MIDRGGSQKHRGGSSQAIENTQIVVVVVVQIVVVVVVAWKRLIRLRNVQSWWSLWFTPQVLPPLKGGIELPPESALRSGPWLGRAWRLEAWQ